MRGRGKWICLTALALAVLGAAAPAHAAPRGCDPLDPAHCLLPWPNDHFRKDGRLALMPHSGDGKPIQASDYNRSDGFSPGQILVTLVPGLDLRRSGAAPVTNIGRSLRRRQPIVVIDAKTGKRQLVWSELNSVAENPRTNAQHQARSGPARGPPLHRGAAWFSTSVRCARRGAASSARRRVLAPRPRRS